MKVSIDLLLVCSQIRTTGTTMRTFHRPADWIGGLAAALCLSFTPLAHAQNSSGQSSSSRADTVSLDVLMRGPVHEAFAEPAASSQSDSSDQTLGTLELPAPIPDPIDEQPARIRPSHTQREAVWIPGYWGVEDQENLCWVSGTWRFAPPAMQWVPGYWADTRDGWVWVPGFWIRESLEELAYLPAPPAPPADVIRYREPRDGRFWVPGSYVWRDNQYVWVDGFYARSQPDWVWVPQRLVRTPRGYLEVPGYWDYPIDRRGTLFAPVRFSNRIVRQTYRPNVAVNVTQALVSWFVRPNYGHYYFGSYYGDRYRDFGLVPWGPYSGRDLTYYDPLFAYYSMTRTSFLDDLMKSHQTLLGSGANTLPVTFNEYQRFRSRGQQTPVGNLARTIDELIRENDTEGFENLREFTSVTDGDVQQRVEDQVRQLRQFAEGRRQTEVDASTQAESEGAVRAEPGEASSETQGSMNAEGGLNVRDTRDDQDQTQGQNRQGRDDQDQQQADGQKNMDEKAAIPGSQTPPSTLDGPFNPNRQRSDESGDRPSTKPNDAATERSGDQNTDPNGNEAAGQSGGEGRDLMKRRADQTGRPLGDRTDAAVQAADEARRQAMERAGQLRPSDRDRGKSDGSNTDQPQADSQLDLRADARANARADARADAERLSRPGSNSQRFDIRRYRQGSESRPGDAGPDQDRGGSSSIAPPPTPRQESDAGLNGPIKAESGVNGNSLRSGSPPSLRGQSRAGQSPPEQSNRGQAKRVADESAASGGNQKPPKPAKDRGKSTDQ
ncbi:MAG: hypothetical protein F9B45_29645 [Phycisphaera sp. RhM]|nr:hypothetical protein [Phycisphaera sp. RhM]